METRRQRNTIPRKNGIALATLILTWIAITGTPQKILAQNTGQILGTVSDASGGAITGAHVTAQLEGEGLTRTAISNSEGGFVIPALPVGSYNVAVEASSFKKFENRNVVVDAEHNVRMDAVLQPGTVTQEVAVSDAPPQVDTSK